VALAPRILSTVPDGRPKRRAAAGAGGRVARVKAGTWTIVTLLLVLATGCGGTRSLTTQQVVDAFRKQTGHHLVRNANSSGGAWDTLDFDDPDPAYRWGSWTLYVASDLKVANRILLSDRHGRPLRADADGIYWYRDDEVDDPYWGMVKRYAANVYLSYVGDRTRASSFDAAFNRVDTALRALD
jgi:hypothetical protein